MLRPSTVWLGVLTCLWFVKIASATSLHEQTIRLTFIGTNDFHGALEPRKSHDGRPVGGMGVIDAYLQAVRSDNPNGVILLDAGDMMQGTLLSAANEGQAVLQFYNDLQYDAATLGNHDFDFGPVGYNSIPTTANDDPLGVIKKRIVEAKFPFVAANLIDRMTGKPPTWLNLCEYTIIERQGVRIGVIGLLSVDTPLTTHPANVAGLEFRPLAPAVRRVLPALRKRGADLVVLLVHADLTLDRLGRATGPVADLAAKMDPSQIDLIISGHHHMPFSEQINGIGVIQNYNSGISFARADIIVQRRAQSVKKISSKLFPAQHYYHHTSEGKTPRYLGRSIRPLQSTLDKLAQFRKSISHLERIRLGRVVRDLTHKTALDSPVGNLVTDAMRAHDAQIQIAMYNSGGLRNSIPQGIVTFGRLYEVVPFDDSLVKVSLTGAQIKEVLEHGLSSSYGVMEISGLQVTVDLQAKPGQRIVSIRTDEGKNLLPDRRYVVGTNEFVLNGGDGYYTFAKGHQIEDTHNLIRELVAKYVKQQGTIAPQMGGRYRWAEKQ